MLNEAVDRSDSLLADHEDATRHVERVISLSEGFSSMYGMELLASVHWAAAHGNSQNRHEIVDYVRAWTERKGSLFTDAHIAAAIARLTEQHWLPVELID